MSRSGSHKEDAVLEFKRQELALKATKEIIVKFIEMGRVTPSSFQETFRSVHSEIKKGLDIRE